MCVCVGICVVKKIWFVVRWLILKLFLICMWYGVICLDSLLLLDKLFIYYIIGKRFYKKNVVEMFMNRKKKKICDLFLYVIKKKN